jgi:hypothetical protein
MVFVTVLALAVKSFTRAASLAPAADPVKHEPARFNQEPGPRRANEDRERVEAQ